MAEIQTSGSNARRIRLMPRVDLTPLVDLSFLLITFFVFTATLSSPVALTTLLPAESNSPMEVAESGVIRLLAGKEGILFFTGKSSEPYRQIAYTDPDAFRQTLLGLRQKIITQWGNDSKMFVMIQPTERATLANLVQLFDEMQICQVKSYALLDPNVAEQQRFAAL